MWLYMWMSGWLLVVAFCSDQTEIEVKKEINLLFRLLYCEILQKYKLIFVSNSENRIWHLFPWEKAPAQTHLLSPADRSGHRLTSSITLELYNSVCVRRWFSASCMIRPGLHSDLQANVSRVEWLRVKEVFKNSLYYFFNFQEDVDLKNLAFKGWLMPECNFVLSTTVKRLNNSIYTKLSVLSPLKQPAKTA